ncbi:hypothetical protein [Streptomyces sp. NPDC018045]|uniref:hypothetical protein n=1 Tax=Streptomyces sp. NPDC018045 TaxID=3365037 RepID=UPI0037A1D1DA
MEERWPAPSARVSELIRSLAEQMLPLSADAVDALWDASQREARQRELADDPVLAQADRRINKANMAHWLMSNPHRPGRRVPPPEKPEMAGFARDLALRGMDVDERGSWRAAQRVAWRRWLHACFDATTDHEVLHELIEVSGHSITTFVDDSIAAVQAYVDQVARSWGTVPTPCATPLCNCCSKARRSAAAGRRSSSVTH